jgi:hypothetical protein
MLPSSSEMELAEEKVTTTGGQVVMLSAEQLDIYLKEASAAAAAAKTPPPTSPRSRTGGDTIWRSKCCSQDGTTIDKTFLSFILTSVLSLAVLLFSLSQLALNPESDLTSLWVSLVSTITSLHVPSPLSQMQQNDAAKKN